MIPERLKPLLTRLKISLSEGAPKSFEDEFLKHIAPTAIKLIEEEGISLQLTKKFQEQKTLEEFIERAAWIIGCPMTREDRKKHYEDVINREFSKIMEDLNKLEDLDKIEYFMTDHEHDLILIKKKEKVVDAIMKYKKSCLSKINLPSNPDNIHILINLFQEYLPQASGPFKDTHIRKMLKPFGIELKTDVVRIKEHRAAGEWFLRQK